MVRLVLIVVACGLGFFAVRVGEVVSRAFDMGGQPFVGGLVILWLWLGLAAALAGIDKWKG